MFESFTKEQRREWFLRIACIALAIVVIIEGMYIWQRGHRAPGRFKSVNEWGGWDGLLAFDTATGQLCRRARWKPSPTKNAPETHPVKEPLPEYCFDPNSKMNPVIKAVRCDGTYTKEAARAKEAEEAAVRYEREAEFVRSLPACVDIR